MENNKSEFKTTGVMYCGAEVLEIQINQSVDAARYRSTVKMVLRDNIVTNGRWQEIRYSKRNGYPYITMYGRKIYLHRFTRVY